MAQGQATLAASNVDGAGRDAGLLLSHVTGMSTSGLHLSRESGLDESRAEKYLELISERSVGNPVAYLTGSTEFFGIELAVACGVYLPKPETEMLVEIALELLNVPRNLDMTWGKSDTSLLIHEIGTGSGAIPIAVARHALGAQIEASDLSTRALNLARANAKAAKVADRIGFHHGDLQRHLPGTPDLVLANLPYISDRHLPALAAEVLAQPRSALVADDDGFGDIVRLLSQLRIKFGGHVILEIGFDQARSCTAPLQLMREIELLADRSGPCRPRSDCRAAGVLSAERCAISIHCNYHVFFAMWVKLSEPFRRT